MNARIRIVKVEALALSVSFDDMFDSTESVPTWLRYPASSHLVLPRRGQYATIVKVHTDDGHVGIGEAYGLPAPEITATVVSRVLAPLMLGEDPLAPQAMWDRLYRGQAAGGHNRGFYLEAIAGVDMALWDLAGKIHGVPVHRLLGGPTRDSVLCYASPVALHDSPEESAAQAQTYVDAGFGALKVKIGRGWRIDRDHLRAVRAQVGDNIEILVDANCAYDLDSATDVGRVLDDVGVRWFEEPLSVDDITGLAQLRQRTGLTIVNGETHFTRFDLRDAVTSHAIDVYMPNVARCGGLSEAMRIAALASAFHVDIAPHGVGSGVNLCAALQLVAATTNVRTYEYNRLPNPMREAILRDPPQFVDGSLLVPTTPGLGFDLDEAAVDRYTVARF